MVSCEVTLSIYISFKNFRNYRTVAEGRAVAEGQPIKISQKAYKEPLNFQSKFLHQIALLYI